MNIHKHHKKIFQSYRKRLYIASSYRNSRIRRSIPRPLLAALAVVAVAGLAVPVTLARQQAEQSADGKLSETHWPQRTSGMSSERSEPPKAATPPAAPAARPDDQAEAAEAQAQAVRQAQAAAQPGLPSKVLDLRNWKIALPIDTPHAGTPDEIKQPELAGFMLSPYFYAGKGGIVFQAHAGGATTKNSKYPRSELREMEPGGGNAAWSNNSGTHTMTIRQAITQTPQAKPHVVAGQIHDGSDDVIMVRLEGRHLFVEADGTTIGTLQDGYNLGTVFTVRIETSNGQIRVFYNDVLKVKYDRAGSSFYFKAGVYTQSNPSRGDAPDAYGQVVIYDLRVTHSQ